MSTPPVEKFMFTRIEAAASLSISVDHLDRMIASGRIRARRIGRSVRIPRQELLRLTREDVLEIRPRKHSREAVAS